MIRNLHEKIGEMTYDHLFAGIFPPADVRGGVIAHGEEEKTLKRGTLLGKKDGRLYVYDGKNGAVPDCVLTDDVVIGTKYDENVTVYISGNFNFEALIVAEGYSITDADEDILRTKNILIGTVHHTSPGPLPPASVIAGSGSTKFYDMEADKLQSDIKLENGVFSGILHYVENYTGFGGENKSGNFFAMTVAAPDGATVYVELLGAKEKPGKIKMPDDDRIFVVRVVDPNTQAIQITVERDGYTAISTYNLTGLVLEEKAD